MTSTPFHLKHRSGWFAAGREMEQALILLSDVAFKLFVWLCLHAERSRGSICISPAELASALYKTESEMRTALEELAQQGVCITAADGVFESLIASGLISVDRSPALPKIWLPTSPK